MGNFNITGRSRIRFDSLAQSGPVTVRFPGKYQILGLHLDASSNCLFSDLHFIVDATISQFSALLFLVSDVQLALHPSASINADLAHISDRL